MMIRVRKLLGPTTAAVALFALTLLVWQVYERMDRKRSVTEFLRAEAIQPELGVGEKLLVGITVLKHEACAGTLNQFFIRRDNGLVCYGGAEPRGFAPVGMSEYLMPVQLPECVTPGAWSYRGVTTYACPDGPHTVMQPDVRFQVREPAT